MPKLCEGVWINKGKAQKVHCEYPGLHQLNGKWYCIYHYRVELMRAEKMKETDDGSNRKN